MEFEGIIVFAILMENNNGILGKAPSYITEKYKLCDIMAHPEALLDTNNLNKFEKYKKIWKIEKVK